MEREKEKVPWHSMAVLGFYRKEGRVMIVFDGLELIGLAIMAVLLVICGIILVIDRIAYAVKKRQQKRIDDAFKEWSE